MELTLRGTGTVVIRFIDRKGRVLLEDQISVSGMERLEARTELPLEVEVKGQAVPVVPVVALKDNPKQKVLFDGQDAERFTASRCRTVGASQKAVAEAKREAVTRRWPQPGAPSKKP